MKLYLPLVIFLFTCLNITAQSSQSVVISGSVFDLDTQLPVEQASVRFLNARDSSYVNGTVTNAEGKFSFRLKAGNYITHIAYMGYTNKYINVNATKPQNNLGKIEMNEDGILLKEAVVTAQIAEIVVKGDTVEYNADTYKVQESAVVEDLLKKMPGAEVDSDGKITVNGKEVKKILVDGKEFFSDDPKVASKNLPAAMVDKLQVLDRKSDMAQMTGFDDGEEETVINLTVKKGMKQGVFGSATVGAGNKDRYGMSGIANYMLDETQITALGGLNNTNNEGFTDNAGNTFGGMRRGGMSFGGRNGITKSGSGGINMAFNPSDKLKWGGNIRYGNNKNNVERDRYVQYYAPENDIMGDQYETRLSRGVNRSNNINADLRFEWTVDSLTRIIFSPRMYYGKNENIQSENYLTTYTNPGDTINLGQADSYSDGDNIDMSGRLEVSRRLNKPGRVLSFSLSGGFNRLDNDGFNFSRTAYYSLISGQDSAVDLRDQQLKRKDKGHNWQGYISFVEPIGNNNFIQLNYSYRKRYSESDKNAMSNDGFENYNIVDTTATNYFENNFINQEIGINFKAVREKYNYTIGVALQPSSMESWVYSPHLDEPIRFKNSVLNFAPVAQFNYMWDRRHNLRINYFGRASQPSISQLVPYMDISDPLNVSIGNPDLKPSFSNQFRLRYQKFNPEQASSFVAFGWFSFSNNDVVAKTIRGDGGKRTTTYENVNGNWNGNMRVMLNRPLRNKKFSINSMSYAAVSQNNGFVNEDKNKATGVNLSEVLGIQFRSDLADFGLRGNYSFSNTKNSLEGREDRTIHRYGGSFSTSWFLPYDFSIESDIAYSATSGSSEGYAQNEWLWNASVSKQVFKSKSGTIKFKFYDILQQKSNISQSASAAAFTETKTNTLRSYFMISFQYKFQKFKGGASRGDMNGGGFGGGRGGYGGGRPPHM